MSSSSTTIMLLNDKRIMGLGLNSSYQLGTGSTSNVTSARYLTPTGVKQVSTGEAHTMILLEDGTIMAAGSNSSGQTGWGTTMSSLTTFQKINNVNGVKQISAGSNFTMLLLEDGSVMVSGDNTNGRLGIGSASNQLSFVKASRLSGVKQVSAGSTHSFALLEDGTLMSTGLNSNGQLGLGDTLNRATFTPVPGVEKVKGVFTGASHTFVLLEDGTLMSTGLNSNGQLGLGDQTARTTFTPVPGIQRVKYVSCGDNNTTILLNDGTGMSTGFNGNCKLGVGLQYNTPTGYNTMVTTFRKMTIEGMSEIFTGKGHTVVLKEDGSVWGVGNGYSGQLGANTSSDNLNFVSVRTASSGEGAVLDLPDFLELSYLQFELTSEYLLLRDRLDFSLNILKSSDPDLKISITGENGLLITSIDKNVSSFPAQIDLSISSDAIIDVFNKTTLAVVSTESEGKEEIDIFKGDGKIMRFKGKIVTREYPVKEGIQNILLKEDHDGDMGCLINAGNGWKSIIPEEYFNIEESENISFAFLGGEKTTLKSFGISWNT
jgi:alpha-tubulin suppressor-like RCC1 family protein